MALWLFEREKKRSGKNEIDELMVDLRAFHFTTEFLQYGLQSMVALFRALSIPQFSISVLS